MLILLPREILIEIFLWFEPPDLKYIGQVCKLWLSITHDQSTITRCLNTNKQRLGFSTSIDWQCPEILDTYSRTCLYPGLEKYLDFYHCLARAVKRIHVLAVHYFLRKAGTTTLSMSEYATLIDLTAHHWHPDVFRALVAKFIYLFPQYYTVDLFINYHSINYQPLLEGLPKPNPMTAMYLPTRRQQLYDPEPTEIITQPQQGLLAGYRKYVNNNSFRPDDGISSELSIVIFTNNRRR